MEHKNVSLDEMLNLLEKSKEKEHPYYYRFNYLYNKKCFAATRIRKEALNLKRERRIFHSIELEPGSPLGRAINRLEKAKSQIGSFNYAGI